MQPAIVVAGLGKRFRRPGADRPTSLKETLLRGLRGLREETFWGLRDISFSVPRGRAVGVIGRNGAGKSTLLRLIGRVGRPDEGSVTAHGRIGALLDLGAGLAHDLTGRENIFIAGVIAGMTRAEVQQRLEAIIAFAELEAFIDSPLRIYSSGMQMRLAFAVAAHCDPDILLIDEVLAVGDLAFQRKCMDRVRAFKEAGCTIMLVSHDPEQIRALCDETIWLQQGTLVAHGPTSEVLEHYMAAMGRREAGTPPLDAAEQGAPAAGARRFGTQEACISGVRLLDRAGQPVSLVPGGAGLCVELAYSVAQAIGRPRASVSLHRPDGTIVLDCTTAATGIELPTLRGDGLLRLHIERLDLVAGEYFVNTGLYSHDWTVTYDYHWLAHRLQVVAPGPQQGLLNPPVRWEIEPGPLQRSEPAARRPLKALSSIEQLPEAVDRSPAME